MQRLLTRIYLVYLDVFITYAVIFKFLLFEIRMWKAEIVFFYHLNKTNQVQVKLTNQRGIFT